MSTFLLPCPQCEAKAVQQGGSTSFVSCSDAACPVSRIKIPVAAWQAWPRTASSSKAVRLENKKLRHELQNVDLRRMSAQSKLDKLVGWLKNSKFSLPSDPINLIEQSLYAVGHLDAADVACGVCNLPPDRKQRYSNPELLFCRRNGCGNAFIEYSRDNWVKKQWELRDERAKVKTDSTPKLDRYRKNIERTRKAGTSGMESLLADQLEISLHQTELLKKLLSTHSN